MQGTRPLTVGALVDHECSSSLDDSYLALSLHQSGLTFLKKNKELFNILNDTIDAALMYNLD